MKKLLVVLLLIACITAVAFASLSTNRAQKQFHKTEKQQDQKKKECRRTCPFAS